MSSYNQIDLREADWRDFSDPSVSEIIKQLTNVPIKPIWVFEFVLADVEVVDGAAHEIRVDFTDDFDNGETTPIVLYIIGAHAQDKAAGTGAQKVTIYGINADGDPASEEVTMHGTAATQIASTTLWTRFIGAQVTQAGTGKVNAGIIQISNTGQGEVYGTIDTGENATIGARVYVPSNYNGFLTMRAGIVAANHATAVLEAFDGVIVKPVYVANPSILATGIYYVPVGSVGMIDLGIAKQLVVGADATYISFTQATKSDDSNQTVVYHIKVIMYGTTNELRGLF